MAVLWRLEFHIISNMVHSFSCFLCPMTRLPWVKEQLPWVIANKWPQWEYTVHCAMTLCNGHSQIEARLSPYNQWRCMNYLLTILGYVYWFMLYALSLVKAEKHTSLTTRYKTSILTTCIIRCCGPIYKATTTNAWLFTIPAKGTSSCAAWPTALLVP